MGKTWFGTNNLLYDSNVTFSTSSEAAAYTAANLGKTRLYPAWHTARKPLYFDGTNDYLYTADHADFHITDNLVVYMVFRPTSLSGTQVLLQKYGSSSGYLIRLIGDDLQLIIGGNNSVHYCTFSSAIEADKWYSAIFSYSNGEPKLIVNGAEAALTLSGTSSTSIGTGNGSLIIGSSGGANYFQGYIQESGIAVATPTEWHTPNPTGGGFMRGYWYLDGWNGSVIEDASNTSHDLTAVSLNAADNVAMKGAHSLRADLKTALDFDTAVIDRRHNLDASADISWNINGWFSRSSVKHPRSTEIIDGGALVMSRSSGLNRYPWFEFIDSGTGGDSYFDIPMIYVGKKSELYRSLLTG